MMEQGCDVVFEGFGHIDDIMIAVGCFFPCDEIKFLRYSAEWIRCRGNTRGNLEHIITISRYVSCEMLYSQASISMRRACTFIGTETI
jgi:hypothetical protein